MKNVRALLLPLNVVSSSPTGILRNDEHTINKHHNNKKRIRRKRKMLDENEITENCGTFLSNAINIPENH